MTDLFNWFQEIVYAPLWFDIPAGEWAIYVLLLSSLPLGGYASRIADRTRERLLSETGGHDLILDAISWPYRAVFRRLHGIQ